MMYDRDIFNCTRPYSSSEGFNGVVAFTDYG